MVLDSERHLSVLIHDQHTELSDPSIKFTTTDIGITFRQHNSGEIYIHFITVTRNSVCVCSPVLSCCCLNVQEDAFSRSDPKPHKGDRLVMVEKEPIAHGYVSLGLVHERDIPSEIVFNCSFELAKLRALLARNRSAPPESVELFVAPNGGVEYMITVMHRKEDEETKSNCQEDNQFIFPERNSDLRRPSFPDGFIWAHETHGRNQQDSQPDCRKGHSPNRSREMLRVARVDVNLSPACGDSIGALARNSISLSSVSDPSRSTSKESSKRRPASSACNLRIDVPAADDFKVIQANNQTVKYTTPSLKGERQRSYPQMDESEHDERSAVITTRQVKGWRRVLVCQTTRDHRDAAMASPITRTAAPEAPVQAKSLSDIGQRARRGFLATDFWKHHANLKVTEQPQAKIQRERYELQSALAMTTSVHIGRHACVPDGGRATAVWTDSEEAAARRPKGLERVPPLPNHFSGRCSFYNEAQCKVRQVLGRRPRRIAAAIAL